MNVRHRHHTVTRRTDCQHLSHQWCGWNTRPIEGGEIGVYNHAAALYHGMVITCAFRQGTIAMYHVM